MTASPHPRLARAAAPRRSPLSARARRAGAVCALALLAAPSALSAETIETGSDVAAATVYPRGATVTREAAFAAPSGRHDIVVDDLPLHIDADSLRVEGESAGAAFAILGLNYRVDRPAPPPLSDPERERLEEEIRAKRFEIRVEEDAVFAARTRREYAEDLRKATLGRPNRGDDAPAAFVDDPDLWVGAMAQLSEEIAQAQRAEREAESSRDDRQRELEELLREYERTTPLPPRGVLTVSVAASEPIDDGLLSIRYLTGRATWSPLYDLRISKGATPEPGSEDAAAPKSTLTIVRRAAVRQATGEDWTGAALTLSTARPTGRLEALPPITEQAQLRPPTPAHLESVGRPSGALTRAMPRSRTEQAESEVMALEGGRPKDGLADAMMADAPAPEPVAAREASALTTYDGAAAIYVIPDPVDVPGDGEVRQARIGAFEMLVETEARVTPARDLTAYLYAIFPNADEPLPPGRASIYRGDAYLGQLNLQYVAPGETKALPLGRYEALKVERRIRDRSEGQEGVFTTSNRRQSRFEINVDNLGDETIRVRLFDSVPFTEDERIKIAINTAPKPATQDVDGRRGAMEWVFPLAPLSEKDISFSYTLSWPEGETLDLRPR